MGKMVDTKLLNMLLKSFPGLLFLMPVKTDCGGGSSSSSTPNMYFVKMTHSCFAEEEYLCCLSGYGSPGKEKNDRAVSPM